MKKNKNVINYNCKHFLGNRPCLFHKKNYVNCDECGYFEPINKRILIIKTGSIGDVLRTTGLLKGIKDKYRNAHITWVTDKSALPLFENNDMVDTLFQSDSTIALLSLKTTQFDIAINLEAEPESAMLATVANAKKKYGYGYSSNGHVIPLNSEAENWFQMGISDPFKKANRMTYQQIMVEICKLNPSVSEKPVLIKNEHENRLTEQFREKHGINKDDIVIGMNTGAGSRWPLKKWNAGNYVALINKLYNSNFDVKIILYGGPEERERNAKIKCDAYPLLIDAGCDNTLRETIAFLDASTILVTGDTLVMHMGIALNKYIFLLLGPTSYHEIDLFGKGEKIISDLDCLCCYDGNCDKTENCMNNISVETVFKNIVAYLEKLGCLESL